MNGLHLTPNLGATICLDSPTDSMQPVRQQAEGIGLCRWPAINGKAEGPHTMDAAAIVVMLIVGAIAGWLASLVVGGPWGLLGYIVAGIIGGVVGGWLLSVAKVNLNLGSPIVNQIVTAAIGAIVVILIARLIA
jgi:uncharacterized membrane protein YeaQ/YmgE (transglycosylase-associated protein family)